MKHVRMISQKPAKAQFDTVLQLVDLARVLLAVYTETVQALVTTGKLDFEDGENGNGDGDGEEA